MDLDYHLNRQRPTKTNSLSACMKLLKVVCSSLKPKMDAFNHARNKYGAVQNKNYILFYKWARNYIAYTGIIVQFCEMMMHIDYAWRFMYASGASWS